MHFNTSIRVLKKQIKLFILAFTQGKYVQFITLSERNCQNLKFRNSYIYVILYSNLLLFNI